MTTYHLLISGPVASIITLFVLYSVVNSLFDIGTFVVDRIEVRRHRKGKCKCVTDTDVSEHGEAWTDPRNYEPWQTL